MFLFSTPRARRRRGPKLYEGGAKAEGRRAAMAELPLADCCNVNGIVNKIDQHASDDDLEKLRLLAAAILPYKIAEDLSKKTYDLYQAVFNKYENESNAVAVFKRLLKGAGYAKRHVEELTQFTVGSQPSPDLDKLYFYELLVQVADEVGNLEDFRYLKNHIPRDLLDINRDKIKTCVQLFLIMVHKRILDPSSVVSTLTRLEKWLKEIHRDDAAEIVKKKIDQVKGELLVVAWFTIIMTLVYHILSYHPAGLESESNWVFPTIAYIQKD